MNILLSNVQYIHVMAMTMLLSGVAITYHRWEAREVRWLVFLILCLAAFIFRVMFGSNAPIVFDFFNGIFIFTPVAFMLGVQSIFDDEFELGKLEWGFISALLLHFGFTLVWRIVGYELSDLAFQVSHDVVFVLTGLCVLRTYWRTINAWSNDFLEFRRKLRMFCVVLLGPAMCVGIIFHHVGNAGAGGAGDEIFMQYADLFVSSSIILGGMYLLMMFGDIRLSLPPMEMIDSKDKPKTERSVSHAEHDYQREVDALHAVMELEKPYLECNLNVAKLAKYTRIPTYKLRITINQVLGYKNFNAYLNVYRIDAAKAMLSDTSHDQTITNISMECGYSTQSTFNKAFRQAMNLTPSEFRELARKKIKLTNHDGDELTAD